MLRTYVRTFGYGMSTVVEVKGVVDTFAAVRAILMLICLGLCDISLQPDPGPPLIKWAESDKSKRQQRTVIRSSPRRSHQSNGRVENYQTQMQGRVRAMLTAMQERTRYRPTADSALMTWIVLHASLLIPCFRDNDAQSPLYRAMGGSYTAEAGGIWRNCSRTSSSSWKWIWKSHTEAGRHVEMRRVAGQERPHGRTPCSNRRRCCKCSKCTTTCRAQLVRRESSISRRDSTEAEVDSNRRCIRSSSSARSTRTRHEDDNENEKLPDKPEDDDHDMQGDMLPETDTTTTNPRMTSSGRGEKR